MLVGRGVVRPVRVYHCNRIWQCLLHTVVVGHNQLHAKLFYILGLF